MISSECPLAFYAPMKPPDDPVPSGDREFARSILHALNLAGFAPQLVSRLKTRDGQGDRARQNAIMEAANAEKARILNLPGAKTWRAWVSYHNYYKAPDLIGPSVSEALGIPYIQIESTRARKRLSGPWARFAHSAEDAADRAALIFHVTKRDAEALQKYAAPNQRIAYLAPFLSEDTLPNPSAQNGPMLSVAMMRFGDKLASYQLIAQTLHALPKSLNWTLDIVGDGPARSEVEAHMSCFTGHVHFTGALEPDHLRKHYEQASLLFWPGVNEAIGLTYLEAQAAGLPVVAQNRPGMCDVIAIKQPKPEDGPKAMAHRLVKLLTEPSLMRAESQTARAFISSGHLVDSAAKLLGREIGALL